MEFGRCLPELRQYAFTRLHGATYQETAVFTITPVGTSNLSCIIIEKEYIEFRDVCEVSVSRVDVTLFRSSFRESWAADSLNAQAVLGACDIASHCAERRIGGQDMMNTHLRTQDCVMPVSPNYV
jgi:hypothetical protein